MSFLALGSWLAPAPAPGAACNGTAAECRDGRFSAPFAEPTLLGVPTTEKCVQAADGRLSSVSRLTGPLAHARWYTSGVLLPTGEVFAVSGADRDEVAAPGLGFAVRQAEIFDPQTETWRGVALQNNPRTYHNTAVLLRDGRVLVGGHAPITTAYLSHIDLSSLVSRPTTGAIPRSRRGRGDPGRGRRRELRTVDRLRNAGRNSRERASSGSCRRTA